MTRPRPPRAASRRARALLGLFLLTSGCAYYNGVYNARHADRAAERALLEGNDSAAVLNFALAAAAAETVLARYPQSRWAPEAMMLAGRGLAFTGSCGTALSRLEEYRGRARDPRDRNRAALASGQCLTSQGRYAEALSVLAPLLTAREREVAVPAARLSARAHLALGDDASAARVLSRVDAGAAEWLLARDALGVGRLSRAESLLARRVAVGDVRDELPEMLRRLWTAGDSAAALRLAVAVSASRAPSPRKARVRLVIGELLAGAGRDVEARETLALVPRLSADSVVVSRARDLMSQLALANAASLDEVTEQMKNPRASDVRLASAALLARVLAREDPITGAGRFLAGEVARDSLRATRLARSLFVTIPETSPLAAKGWLAAAALAGDSAGAYVSHARGRWPTSPYVLAVDGKDANDSLAIAVPELALRAAWAHAIVVYGDSVLSRRAATIGTASPPPP